MILFFVSLLCLWVLSGWFGLFVIYRNTDDFTRRQMRIWLYPYVLAGAISGFLVWIELIVKEVENG